MDKSLYTRASLMPPTGRSFESGPRSFPISPAQPHFPQETVVGGLPEVWKILRRHRGVLLAAALLGVAVGVGLSFLQAPRYRARTALLIQNPNMDFLNTRQVNPVGEAPTTDNGLTDITTQIQIMQSDQLLDRVLNKLRTDGEIAPLEQQARNGSSFLHRLIHGSNPSADEIDYVIHQQVAKNLLVKQLGPTRAVEILYTSTDAKFAATFANTVASEFIDSSMEEHLNKSRQTERWLSAQLEDMRKRLQQSEAALQAYARSSGLLFATTSGDSPGNSDISGSKLSQLQAELSAAQNDRVSAQSHYETALSAKPADLPDVLNDMLLRSLQDKLTDLQRQRAELLAIYTDKNERVRKIDSQIPPLESAYAAQRNAILNRIHDDYMMALRREKLLKADYQDQANIVIDKTNKGIQYGILKRQVDSTQQLYDSMLEQVKRAGIASTIQASNIQVFDPAKAPRKPYSPNLVLNAGLGLAGGLLTGSLLLLFAHWGNKTLLGAEDLQSKTGLRVLGEIPNGWAELASRSVRGRLLTAGRSAVWPSKDSRTSLDTFDKDAIELVAWSRKPSFTAESFRSLLTSVLFADEHGSRPRTIVVSSANAMEGKTTVACNLGIVMAQLHNRVLVIDADLRNPRIHKVFDLENEFGLSTILSRPTFNAQSNLEIMPTFVPGLFVLPGGPATPVAANLLHSTQLLEILNTLRTQFDTIIIDTPPCLLATDARVVGRLSDAVLLVVRAGRTPWEEAQAVVQQFELDRTRVLGTVLNDLKKPVRDYAYYQATS
jgi:polysaccharide biosynthesis transport protein